MTRLLLFALFFVIFAGDALGINVGIAPGLSVKNLFLYIILVSILIDAALARNRQIEGLSVLIPYFLCFVYATFTWIFVLLLSLYQGYDPLITLMGLKGGLADHVIVFFVFFYGLLERSAALNMLRMITWTVLIGNVLTIADVYNLPNFGIFDGTYDGRIVGLIGEPNQYAAIIVLFFPLSIALVLQERKYRKLIAIFAIASTLLALLLTASRGGLVALLVGAVVSAIYLRKSIQGKHMAVAVIGTCIAMVASILVLYLTGDGGLLYERTIGLSTSGNAFDASSGRNFIWATALGVMSEQPLSFLIGYGWDSYRHFPDFSLAPHNTYLKYFFELGVLGLSLVLITFINFLRVTRSALTVADDSSRAFLIGSVFGFSSYLIAIFFVDITTAWILVWALIGIVMRMSVKERHDSTNLESGSVTKMIRRRS